MLLCNLTTNISLVGLMMIAILLLTSVSFHRCEEQQTQEPQEPVDQTASGSESQNNQVQSNYGVRLPESSSLFQMSTFQSKNNHLHDSKAEESTQYTSGINAIMNSDGFLSQMEKYGSNEPKYSPIGPVEAAVHTKKTIEVIPVRFDEPKEGEPQVIEITPYEVPLSIVFRTQTNKINVNQEHKSEAAEEVKETSSEEEPHRVVHNVYRPVIQEVNEVIQPYRKVMQKVEPVIEEMKTIITKAAPNDGSKPIQQQQQQQPLHQYQRQQLQSSYSSKNTEFIPMTRFGGNELGTGSSGLAYGSELIKKYTTAPSSGQSSGEIYVSSDKKLHEMSRRYGFSNGQPNNGEQEENGSNSQENTTQWRPVDGPMVGSSFLLSKNELNSKLEPLDAPVKDTNYNEIINGYIEKLLEQKAQQSASGKSSSGLQINPNSIKILNLPMKGMPGSITDSKDAAQLMDKNKRFKVIQEFRVSLNDLKKQYKVTPITPKYNEKTGTIDYKKGLTLGSLYSQNVNAKKNNNRFANFRSFGNGFHPSNGPKVTYASSSRPNYHMAASTVRKHRMAPSGRPEPRSAGNFNNNNDFRQNNRNSPKRFGELSPNHRPNFSNRRFSKFQIGDRMFSRRRMMVDSPLIGESSFSNPRLSQMDNFGQESRQSFSHRFKPLAIFQRRSSFDQIQDQFSESAPLFGMPIESSKHWPR